MKTQSKPPYPQTSFHSTAGPSGDRVLSGLAAILVLLGSQSPASAQGIVTDNFDSGSLDPQWKVRNICQVGGGFVSDSFPTNGAGKALRLQRGSFSAAAIGFPSQDYGTGRAWLYRTNDYSDFCVAMDLVDWNNNTNQAIVLIGRGTGFDDNIVGAPGFEGFGTVDGYICNYDCAQDGTGSGDRLGGQFQINVVSDEAPLTVAAAEVTLIPGHTYRQILKGQGSALTAQLYDLEDLTQPIVTVVTNDAIVGYTSGKSGIVTFHRDGGTHPNRTDMTVDNYYSGSADPNADIAPAIRHPVAGTPQVVTRTPVKRYTNFHPAASGITFTARTFTTNEINAAATKLYLNDVDVSASLAPLPANGNTASFSTAAGTLAANKVYSARIELTDTNGVLKSTNTFWFDTFTDGFLATAPVKTVEAEDYNYANGQYQPDPIPVSGMHTNASQIVNGSGTGYYDLVGTPDVDYSKPGGHYRASWAEYRTADRVQITQGSYSTLADDEAADILDGAHGGGVQAWRTHDTQRAKYVAAKVWEYQVRLTSPGDWMNYTRSFAGTNYYVYLRCGSFGATTVYLDQVTSDPTQPGQTTNRLGAFNVRNHTMRLNYAYEPLVGESGEPLLLNLSGTQTLRLTLGGVPTKHERMVVMDYLLFVPTSDVPPVPTIFDPFTDGNDTANPAWDHYDPIGNMTAPPASFLFTNGGYRIYAPSPMVADAGQARAGSFLSGVSYSDFFVSADIIDFDDTVRQVFGIAARVGTPGLGTTDGYLFSWEAGGGTLPGTNNGDLDISPLFAETPIGQLENGTGQNSNLHLTRGKSYRFTFQGKGFDFVAKVYELPETSSPLITLTVNDPNSLYASGKVGVIAASQGSFTIPGDATFDNFLVTTAEPRLEATVTGGNIRLTWPIIPFRLQVCTSFTAPVWTTITSGIVESGGMNVYTAPTADVKFYRLVYP